MNEKRLPTKTLGLYHLGEYFTETMFNHASLLYTDFQSNLELVTGLTAYHENIHFLQDIGTGFGCFYSEISRSRNESILFNLRRWDKSEVMKIPFITHVDISSNSKYKNKEVIKECLSDYKYHNDIISCFFDQKFSTKIFGYLNILPKNKDWIEKASKIGINELYEGVTTLFSHYFCTYFGKEHKDFFRTRINSLPEEYSRTLKYLSQTLFPFYKTIPIDKKLYLLFLLSDLSLHIPHPDLVYSMMRSNSQDYPIKDFIPGWRFFHAINGIIDLDLEFPDISKEGYTEFVNEICNHPELKWPTMEATTDSWIKFLKNQSKLAWDDSSVKWKIAMMNRRKEIPHLFSSFWDIHQTVLAERDSIPFIGRTKASNWVYVKGNLSEWDDTRRVIFQKIFLNSVINQIIESGILLCPLPKWLISCHRERQECKSEINTSDSYYSKDCAYSHWFELFFQIPFNILQQPMEHKTRDSSEVKYEQSMEEIIQNLIDTAISGDITGMKDEINKVRKNDLYRYLKPTNVSDEELLPSFVPEFLECDIPKGAKAFVVDARWGRAWALLAMGLYFVDKNDVNNAINEFKEMTEKYPNFWQGWYNLGTQLNKLDRDLEAFKVYGEALKRNPTDYKTWSNLGFSLAKIKKWREAVIFLEEAKALEPNDYMTLNTLGVCYRQIGDFKTSIRCLNKALQIDSERWEAWKNLYDTLKIAGKEKEAEAVDVKFEELYIQGKINLNMRGKQ